MNNSVFSSLAGALPLILPFVFCSFFSWLPLFYLYFGFEEIALEVLNDVATLSSRACFACFGVRGGRSRRRAKFKRHTHTPWPCLSCVVFHFYFRVHLKIMRRQKFRFVLLMFAFAKRCSGACVVTERVVRQPLQACDEQGRDAAGTSSDGGQVQCVICMCVASDTSMYFTKWNSNVTTN